jgi:predicted nucleic acid-binding Zn ribbon protein
MNHLIFIFASVLFCLAPISPVDSDGDGIADSILQDEERRQAYPLKHCVQCSDTLGIGMYPHDVLYLRASAPDQKQLVRFCSPTCQRIFERTPKRSWKKFDLLLLNKKQPATQVASPV